MAKEPSFNGESGYITDPDDQELVFVDVEYEPLILPVRQYEFFMANGSRGIEAMTLLLHLLYTSRRQHTNQVWAANTYIRKGLSLGERTVKRAKAFLHEHGFISYVQPRNSAGTMEKNYIRLNYIRNPGKREDSTAGAFTAPPVNRTTGDSIQMLEETIEMLKETTNPEEPAESAPPVEDGGFALEGESVLLERVNEGLNLEISLPGFTRTIEELLAVDTRLVSYEYIAQTYEAKRKENKGTCSEGLLLYALKIPTHQKKYLANLDKPTPKPKEPRAVLACPVCGTAMRHATEYDDICEHCKYSTNDAEVLPTIKAAYEAKGVEGVASYYDEAARRFSESMAAILQKTA